MGTIVYAVFSGEYSDRRLDAIFSTSERAQEYITKGELLNCDVDSRAREYELDSVSINDDIFMKQEYEGVFYPWNDEANESEERDIFTNYEGDLCIKVHYNPDVEVMRKAAQDKYAEYKARKEGI